MFINLLDLAYLTHTLFTVKGFIGCYAMKWFEHKIVSTPKNGKIIQKSDESLLAGMKLPI